MRMWKTFSSLTIIIVLCAAAAQAQPRSNGFSVVLLVGDTQGTASGDGLPTAAGLRKALSDLKDFLPYKSYKVLDTAWLQGGETRMKGLEEQEYEVEVTNIDLIQPNIATRISGRLNIAFTLQEPGAAMNSSEEFGRLAQAASLEKERGQIQANLADLSAKYKEQHPAVVQLKARLAQVERSLRLARARKLIDSRFEMSPGETVVVGTSKLGGGDKALVVLLTAVAAGGK